MRIFFSSNFWLNATEIYVRVYIRILSIVLLLIRGLGLDDECKWFCLYPWNIKSKRFSGYIPREKRVELCIFVIALTSWTDVAYTLYFVSAINETRIGSLNSLKPKVIKAKEFVRQGEEGCIVSLSSRYLYLYIFTEIEFLRHFFCREKLEKFLTYRCNERIHR